MSYDPVKYWSNRVKPNKYSHVKQHEVKTLYPLVKEAKTILDYGIGTGRLMPLYTGKKVRGIDIVDNYRDECQSKATKYNVTLKWSKDIDGYYDLGVLSKVLLHSPNPKPIIDEIAKRCKKVYISTGINLDAEHCFNHDYKKLLWKYDILYYNVKGQDLTIVF